MQYEKIVLDLWEKAKNKFDDINDVVVCFDSLVKEKADTLKEFGYGSYIFENEAKDFRNRESSRINGFQEAFKNAVLSENC